MTTFRTSRHLVNGTSVCEVWHDGAMIAAIYPTERGVKIVSKHLERRVSDADPLVAIDPDLTPAIIVNILP
jgi:hypothetical protein